mmetsp:Transcript_20076/g.41593  ORF Transcript_20076/g.41593 Transcript_20076/m.41593 type:complete len:396 (-) Transcript_20076:758-1945(-)
MWRNSMAAPVRPSCSEPGGGANDGAIGGAGRAPPGEGRRRPRPRSCWCCGRWCCCCCCCCGDNTRGRQKEKVDPFPVELFSAQMQPRILWTNIWQRCRPRPVPVGWPTELLPRVRFGGRSRRAKREKSRRDWSESIPGPESDTETTSTGAPPGGGCCCRAGDDVDDDDVVDGSSHPDEQAIEARRAARVSPTVEERVPMEIVVPRSVYLMALETMLMRTCWSLRALAFTNAFAVSPLQFLTMFTPEIDASGLQKSMASRIGSEANSGARRNSSIMFAVAFLTSKRLLIRFNNKLEDAITRPRDSMASFPKEEPATGSMPASRVKSCSSKRLVMPMIPWSGVRSSCVSVTMDSFIAFESSASSRAICSACSLARSAVMSWKATKNNLLLFFVAKPP